MAGKNKGSQPAMVDEGIAKMIEELRNDFTAQLAAYSARFDELKSLLACSNKKVCDLEKALEEKEREVQDIRKKANDQAPLCLHTLTSWRLPTSCRPGPTRPHPSLPGFTPETSRPWCSGSRRSSPSSSRTSLRPRQPVKPETGPGSSSPGLPSPSMRISQQPTSRR